MSTAPFRDSCDEFLAWLLTARGRSRATVGSYGRDLQQLADLAQIESLAQLDRAAVLRWNTALIGLEQSPRSRARKLSALRSFVAWALEYRYMPADPIPPELSVPAALYLPHALSEAEVRAMLDAVPPSVGAGVAAAAAARDRAVLEVLYASGMRVSELCGLSLLDLHLGEGFAIVTGKGGKQRLTPLGQYAIDALKAWIPLRGELCSRAGAHDEVFLTRRGPISRSAVFRLIKGCAAVAGIGGKVSPHTFRHSCASHMLAHGADLRLVQELLGHALLSTTQVYTHIEKSRLRRVYDACHPMA